MPDREFEYSVTDVFDVCAGSDLAIKTKEGWRIVEARADFQWFLLSRPRTAEEAADQAQAAIAEANNHRWEADRNARTAEREAAKIAADLAKADAQIERMKTKSEAAAKRHQKTIDAKHKLEADCAKVRGAIGDLKWREITEGE